MHTANIQAKYIYQRNLSLNVEQPPAQYQAGNEIQSKKEGWGRF